MAHKLTWHGHANFQITTDTASLLIDPWFEGNPSAGTSSKEVTSADLVLVTHDHSDHMGQAVEICKATGAKILAIVETAKKIVDAGLPQQQVVNGIGMNIGGTVTFKGIRVTMVQAAHTSESGLAAGYILVLPDGFTLYHAGDTGIFSEMELYGRLFSIDLALLPIGGVFTMDPRQAALACELLGCRSVVPMHWGSFPVLEKSTASFRAELEKTSPGTRLFDMQPGQTIELPGKEQIENCEC